VHLLVSEQHIDSIMHGATLQASQIIQRVKIIKICLNYLRFMTSYKLF